MRLICGGLPQTTCVCTTRKYPTEQPTRSANFRSLQLPIARNPPANLNEVEPCSPTLRRLRFPAALRWVGGAVILLPRRGCAVLGTGHPFDSRPLRQCRLRFCLGAVYHLTNRGNN